MKISFTLKQIEDMMSDQGGFCIACGEEAYSIEPDARKYECEYCGKNKVYGAEELVISFPEMIVDA